ncbi:MAG: hypothetical protein R2865_08440 [Deinococcales bacterium]
MRLRLKLIAVELGRGIVTDHDAKLGVFFKAVAQSNAAGIYA